MAEGPRRQPVRTDPQFFLSRAGVFFANTYNLPARPKWEMEALTVHSVLGQRIRAWVETVRE